ncbi:HAD domain-containing protein [Paraburkholderia sp. EG287A]|uniref:HAD domain-containing protein n=1 Tax=Paraburkholderia sp. EG287A TaxID=3237012 RepID=UPI0034D28F83
MSGRHPASVDSRAQTTIVDMRSRRNVRAETAKAQNSNTEKSRPPTLFVDFDGTLHVGHASMDEHGEIALDTGRPLFEFAPLLVDLLAPYPEVVLVLTTSWLMTLNAREVASRLPLELVRRVVGTTRDIKPRLSYLLNGTARTYVIASYAYGASLTKWLAIDDSVFGAEGFGREPGELSHHFVLLDSAQGLGDPGAQQRVKQWLREA